LHEPGRVRIPAEQPRLARNQGEIGWNQRWQLGEPGRRRDAEEPREGRPRLIGPQRLEPHLHQEAPQTGRVQPLGQVGGAGEGQGVVLHPGEQLVHLRHLPGLGSAAPVGEQAVGFVEDQEAPRLRRLLERSRDRLLAAADPA
jgi:hypothetical protein